MGEKRKTICRCLSLTGALTIFNGLHPGHAVADIQSIQPRFGFTNTTDILANVHGGIRTGVRVLDKLYLIATFVGGSDLLLGGSGLVDLQWTDATNFSGKL